MLLTKLIMLPDEIEVVQKVFNEIVAEPWFDQSVEAKSNFAAFVMSTYHEGIADYARLRAWCLAAAEMMYSV